MFGRGNKDRLDQENHELQPTGLPSAPLTIPMPPVKKYVPPHLVHLHELKTKQDELLAEEVKLVELINTSHERLASTRMAIRSIEDAAISMQKIIHPPKIESITTVMNKTAQTATVKQPQSLNPQPPVVPTSKEDADSAFEDLDFEISAADMAALLTEDRDERRPN